MSDVMSESYSPVAEFAERLNDIDAKRDNLKLSFGSNF